MDEAYATTFGGIGRLYGVEPLERLSRSHVCVVGIGGVGSWAVEALARSGVGALTLIDMDDICVTNINRQLHAMHDTVGLQKIDVMAQRVKLINPGCQVNVISDFVLKDTIDELLSTEYDMVLDAIDDLNNKCVLIANCKSRGIPIVTVGGAGGRRDPTLIRTADLTKSTHDGLLRRARRKLKYDYDFPAAGPWGISSVFSTEHQVFPTEDGGVCEIPEKHASWTLDCESGFGTATFVTGAYGFVATSLVVQHLMAQTP